MYIVNDRDRILNIATTALLFIVIFSLIVTNSPIMMTFDALISDFILGLSFNHPILNQLLSFLGNPAMTGFYTFILWFLLWGFKHKLIAFWAICTYITGEILFLIIKKIVSRELPKSHPENLSTGSFPSHYVFSMTLVFMFIYVCALPFIKKRWHAWIITTVMWLVIFLLAIARIQMHANYSFDTVAGVLLAYSWVEIWELIYLKFFHNLTNTRIFRHSDFN